MFRNRTLVVNVAKKSDIIEETKDPRDDITWQAHTSVMMENAVMGGLLLMGAYFLGDTLRGCIIHTVAVRVTPPVIVEAAKK